MAELEFQYFQLNDVGEISVLKLTPHAYSTRYHEKQREYNAVLQHLEAKEEPLVAFDFSSCEFIDSITIGMLVQITYRVRTRGGNAVLVNISENLMDVCRSLMLLETRTAVWTRYETLEDALASLPW